jgi:hypothetical protein
MTTERINQLVVNGAQAYTVGDKLLGRIIYYIESTYLYVQGDPYEHWAILDEDRNVLATVNKLIPCVVVYTPKK